MEKRYKQVSLKCSLLAIKGSPRAKVSSQITRELDVRVLSVFGEGMLRVARNKEAMIGGLTKKLKQLYQAFQKAPNLWNKFKEVLGVTATNSVDMYFEVSKKFQNLLDEGAKWWARVKARMKKESKIIHFIFLYASNAPTFTSIVNGILQKSDLGKWVLKTTSPLVGRAKSLSQWIDNFLDRHPLLKILTMPAKAYLYWVIWINVTEISWKVTDLLKGFLGLISWTDLLESLPESGIGYLIGLLFPGIPGGWVAKSLSIGWNAILAPAVGLQLYALYTKGLVDERGQPIPV
jgi:hypothetical protein